MDQNKLDIKKFLLSGAMGFVLGWFLAKYQWAVQAGQILAGIVRFPNNNPFYIWTTKTWTLINQISAILLYLGFSEKTLSLLLSGLAGMIIILALSLILYALSKNYYFSFLLSFFVLFLHGVYAEGITYPLILIGNDNTYGMLGLSFFLLVMGLLMNSKYKWGLLLLGILPAIHPGQGIWVNLTILLSFIFISKKFWMKKNIYLLKYLIIGYFISLISLLYHYFFVYDVPPMTADVLRPYWQSVFLNWNHHFLKFNLFGETITRVFISLILSIWVVKVCKKDLPLSIIFFALTMIVSAVLAGSFSCVYWLPAEKASSFYNLLNLLPARFLNYNLIGSLLLLLGLLVRFQKNNYHRLNLFIIISSLAIYRLLYNGKYLLRLLNDPVAVGLTLLSTLCFIIFFKPKKYLIRKGKITKAYILLHLIFLSGIVFYGSYTITKPVTPNVFAMVVIFISFIIFLINMTLSNNFQKRPKIMFYYEGAFLIVIGLLLIYLKTLPTPWAILNYSFIMRLINLLYIPFILFGGSIIILINYFPKSIIYFKYKLKEININFIPKFTANILYLELFLIMFIMFINAYSKYKVNKKNYFLDWTDDYFLNVVKERGGLLIPGTELGWLPSNTRRPALLISAPSFLAYAPEGGPEQEHIFQKIYGESFLNPSAEVVYSGKDLSTKKVQNLWEKRSLAEWQEIKKEFNATDVVVQNTWHLNLKKIIANEKYILYEISD